MIGVRLDVRGLPIPQGSTRAFVAGGRAIIATDGNRPSSPLGAWRSAVASEARAAIGSAPPLAGPVRVDLTFRLPRPRSHYLPANGRRSSPVLRLDAPTWHAGKPDADKLTRAALDALSAVVFGDDAQVARLTVSKRYAEPTEGPGVAVVVDRLPVTA
jgi:Holliday junction resolvase RusA-like endonuclease